MTGLDDLQGSFPIQMILFWSGAAEHLGGGFEGFGPWTTTRWVGFGGAVWFVFYVAWRA